MDMYSKMPTGWANDSSTRDEVLATVRQYEAERERRSRKSSPKGKGVDEIVLGGGWVSLLTNKYGLEEWTIFGAEIRQKFDSFLALKGIDKNERIPHEIIDEFRPEYERMVKISRVADLYSQIIEEMKATL